MAGLLQAPGCALAGRGALPARHRRWGDRGVPAAWHAGNGALTARIALAGEVSVGVGLLRSRGWAQRWEATMNPADASSSGPFHACAGGGCVARFDDCAGDRRPAGAAVRPIPPLRGSHRSCATSIGGITCPIQLGDFWHRFFGTTHPSADPRESQLPRPTLSRDCSRSVTLGATATSQARAGLRHEAPPGQAKYPPDMDGNSAVSAPTPLRPEPAVLRALEACAP